LSESQRSSSSATQNPLRFAVTNEDSATRSAVAMRGTLAENGAVRPGRTPKPL
jgi:hypothetical protein